VIRTRRPETSDVVGPYRVEAEEGAAGAARAVDTRDGTAVRLHLVEADPASLRQVRARLEQRVEALARLSHPRLAAVRDFGVHEGALYMAADWVDGRSLRHLLDGSPALPLVQVAAIAQDVGEALDALHGIGLEHGAVGPDSILVDERAGAARGYLVDVAVPAGQGGGDRAADVAGLARALLDMLGATADPGARVEALADIDGGPELLRRATADDPEEAFATGGELGAAVMEVAKARVRAHWRRSLDAPSTGPPVLARRSAPDRPASTSRRRSDGAAGEEAAAGGSRQPAPPPPPRRPGGAAPLVGTPPRRRRFAALAAAVAALAVAGTATALIASRDRGDGPGGATGGAGPALDYSVVLFTSARRDRAMERVQRARLAGFDPRLLVRSQGAADLPDGEIAVLVGRFASRAAAQRQADVIRRRGVALGPYVRRVDHRATVAPPPPGPSDPWPSGTSAYTVVIFDGPRRERALERARRAEAADFDAGMLVARPGEDLPVGQHVAFVGHFRSLAEAERGAAQIRRRGVAVRPYVRLIRRGGTPPAPGAAPPAGPA
jgi:tRNA A-37 threonylcarbamoyl transferase component Bud32